MSAARRRIDSINMRAQSERLCDRAQALFVVVGCQTAGGAATDQAPSLKRRMISVSFCPPKPKLFDSATSTFALRATFGT